MKQDVCVKTEHLTFRYPGRETPALTDVSLTIRKGEFVVLCGPSGCGKTTLLRQFKPAIAPHGVLDGEIELFGRPLGDLSQREQSQWIGFVRQSPDSQIVTDKVWHELAFGMESLGFDTPAIRRRVAEMASFFGMEDWFHRDVASLSGGQKQLLNLAAVMILRPQLLILDEPTSQLDPIAASEFLFTLGRIHRELGTTILLTEHRLEEAIPLADCVLVMKEGRVAAQGAASEVADILRQRGDGMFLSMPTPMRVWAAVETDLPCPVSVRDGREWLAAFAQERELHVVPQKDPAPDGAEILTARDLWYRYEKNGLDVVRGLCLSLRRGEFLALMGGNGMGKTTALKLLCGLLRPQRGEVSVHGRIGMLPQDPQALLSAKTVFEELEAVSRDAESRDRMIRLCRLEDLLDRHPYDLSGGEQQRIALAKVLLTDPDVLLLDEPTKGLDASFKQNLAEILTELLSSGKSVLMVSHDVEFCACYAHRCALLFDGTIATDAPRREFFSGNSFYTTAANRMAGELLPDAITAEDLICACGGRPGTVIREPEREADIPDVSRKQRKERLPRWRAWLAAVFGVSALVSLVGILRNTDLSALIDANGATALSSTQWILTAVLLCSLLGLSLSVTRRRAGPVTIRRGSLPARAVAAAVMILLLVPATLILGESLFGGRRYNFIALLVLLECMTPFFLIFEARRPMARELVLVAVLCAIGVAGRAVFFMLPQFKPVMALAIVAGVSLGGETGFLVGAVTMLTSNVLFSQGPWTPWQMFAMGLVGFLAGWLFRRVRPGRLSLCLFGAVSAIVLYGGIMNLASALMWAGELNWKILLTYELTGLPMDCVHAVATWIFLWFAAEPMMEKLERIKVKYGPIPTGEQTT